MPCTIVHRDNAHYKGRALTEKMVTDSRQMFDVAIQAADRRSDRRPDYGQGTQKDVLAKCYGGDVSQAQAVGDRRPVKRMKQVGNVEIRKKPSSPCSGWIVRSYVTKFPPSASHCRSAVCALLTLKIRCSCAVSAPRSVTIRAVFHSRKWRWLSSS